MSSQEPPPPPPPSGAPPPVRPPRRGPTFLEALSHRFDEWKGHYDRRRMGSAFLLTRPALAVCLLATLYGTGVYLYKQEQEREQDKRQYLHTALFSGRRDVYFRKNDVLVYNGEANKTNNKSNEEEKKSDDF